MLFPRLRICIHADQTPVLLSCTEDAPPHTQLLLNLRPSTPQHFARFDRLLEVVGLEDADRLQARERFRFYRDRGYTLRSHTLGQAGERSWFINELLIFGESAGS